MPKASSDNLFQLIKSLEKSEKRYFKLYTSIHTIGKQNKYVLLFDMIEAMDEYNESTLLSDKNFNRKSFFELKNYLYHLIMKSLESYHSSIDSDLRGYLHQIEILSEKRLYKQCEKLIRKSKKIAYARERYQILLNLLNCEVTLASQQYYHGINEKWIDSVFKEMDKIIGNVKQMNDAYHLISLIYYRNNQVGLNRNINTKSKNEELFNRFKKLHLSDKSFVSQSCVYDFYDAYYASLNDFETSRKYSAKKIALYEQYPDWMEVNNSSYINCIKNLVVNSLSNGHYDQIPELIEKGKSSIHAFPRVTDEYYCAFISLELDYYIRTGRFKDGVALIESEEKKLFSIDERVFNMYQKTLFWYNAGVIYIGAKYFNKAKRFFNKVIASPEAQLITDIQSFTRIVSMIVYYELGEDELLDSAIRSTYRFLKKSKRLYKLETIVLNHIRKRLLKVKTNEELVKLFKQLRKELETLKNDPYESNAFHYFDFISWLDGKIEGKSFEKVVQLQAKTN